MINLRPDWLIQMRKKFIRHFLFVIFSKSAILAETDLRSPEFKCFTDEKSFQNHVLVDLNEKHAWKWKHKTPKQGLIACNRILTNLVNRFKDQGQN